MLFENELSLKKSRFGVFLRYNILKQEKVYENLNDFLNSL